MKGKTILLLLLGVLVGCLLLIVVLFLLLGPRRGETFSNISAGQPTVAGFFLESPAFVDGQPIPTLYTCQGENISPPLTWGDPPEGTRSFALIMEDPDAPGGTWVHWVIYSLPAEMRSLPADFQPGEEVPIRLARNSWGKRAYGGPCPPAGAHRYVFQLYALDTILEQDIADKTALLKAMEGHVLAYAELMGTYQKQR